MNDLKPLLKLLNIHFNDEKLLHQALVHRSSLNEFKNTFSSSNERLEFLGDAVLELWTSNTLYHKFPDKNEGQMTNLRSLIVRTENLASIALSLKIGDYLYLSRGEETHGGRQNISILADTLESIIGAIYLDGGQSTADLFLSQILQSSIDNFSQKTEYKDPKSIFQEIAQAKKGITPNYQIISQDGPDHDKKFISGAYIGHKLIAQGQGNSKQKAEEQAAINATQEININSKIQ
ncbi:ribonuclease III [Candidatus Shapirobacteria bacterium CG_4_8_14_3_um_filter_35_11]|uniref:Ribonuclease 3 n=6 Tax=Candidatus Shapironibacteriota TaxID=1752721 RepID=A0A1J5HPD4_9BACT|nr:MAG: ribonuclease III [Candidatus Shapirobacteria bacterium CG2_30_35_20]PIV06728.1 MAG: ribonuclease III [Candidatus Shapirobacteria bacterium CG03_land_8_20_14_0_80_35_14]PJA50769.1 MAG: ribonuclease III [Candidatus Shapirobacteria bacterium CG_4_9_14_3_um_filter_36_12]PJC79657.1 MAG: ribonuclease III [Candidatus Shapirobacteria bacterium CG_4_8_14_3_um_filter_35_11]